MKSILIVSAALFTATSTWAAALIECRFGGEEIYKMSILLNQGNEGLSLLWNDSDRPFVNLVQGREQEVVCFTPVEGTDRYLLRAYDFGSPQPDVTAFFEATSEREMNVEMLLTAQGTTRHYVGRCLVQGH